MRVNINLCDNRPPGNSSIFEYRYYDFAANGETAREVIILGGHIVDTERRGAFDGLSADTAPVRYTDVLGRFARKWPEDQDSILRYREIESEPVVVGNLSLQKIAHKMQPRLPLRTAFQLSQCSFKQSIVVGDLLTLPFHRRYYRVFCPRGTRDDYHK